MQQWQHDQVISNQTIIGHKWDDLGSDNYGEPPKEVEHDGF